ncbi:MAG: tRNA pseudouridine(13) synthase TruD [bacterium]|nr:tRNA pseudouridine(13) synthase TruD [bacterium]
MPNDEDLPENENPQSLTVPLISAGLPGIGGRIKSDAAHFIVEEIPLYPTSGEGEHIYLTITREDRETRALVRDMTRLFGIREADIGTAGLKDRHARTTQTFSLHLHKMDPDEAARRVESELGVRVIAATRHGNKLRTGHLAGNRFEILVVDPVADALDKARAKWDHLRERAVPNYYGEQRFGREGDNAERGRDLLLGRSRDRPGKWLKRFLLSAFQSELFNLWLARRISNDDFLRLCNGDVARKTDSGGLFVVRDLEADAARFRAGEIDFTGPIFGKKMTAPEGAPAEDEAELLEAAGVDPGDFARAKLDGSRRSSRLWPASLALSFEADGAGVRFRFELPPGSYATVVLREFIQTDASKSTSAAVEGGPGSPQPEGGDA